MKAEPQTTLIIFGVSGDLAGRYVLPAIYWLLAGGKLPENFQVIGVARREVTPESLAAAARQHLNGAADPAILARLQSLITVVQMDSKDPDSYGPLREVLQRIESGANQITRLLHLSIPPAVAMPIVEALGKVGLAQPAGMTTRLMLEKPFGYDLASAERLDHDLGRWFAPEQIFRIDHYMAKETAQNIAVFRFQNPIISDVWDNKCVQRIEIEASEAIGIEGRTDFYEATGALRDIIQSHLINLMALTMMERPKGDSVAAVHTAREQLIDAIKPIDLSRLPEVAWRGQYDSYRQEVDNADSLTETFAALRLEVDNDRWRGVPVWLSTGKGLAAKCTEIRLMFCEDNPRAPNWLRLRFYPHEGIELELRAKRPGLHKDTTAIHLRYEYPARWEHQPDSYEHVIMDAVAGDQANFTTGAEILAVWRLLEPLIRVWAQSDDGLESYPFGSNGPELPGLLLPEEPS